MSPVIVLAGVAVTAFVSTNVDAFLLLVANAARAPLSRRAAAAGFVGATVVVLAVAWALAAASAVIPPASTGLLGLVPLGLGLKELVALIRRRAARARRRAASPDAPPSSHPPPSDSIRFAEALVLHLSLSADNLAVYSALLADTLPRLRPVVTATTLVLALVWTLLARAAIRVPGLSPALLRRGHAVMAALLIAVGVYILVDTETDVLLPAATRRGPAAVSG
jgi:cadmium resistance protein CadD (predicted permease)